MLLNVNKKKTLRGFDKIIITCVAFLVLILGLFFYFRPDVFFKILNGLITILMNIFVFVLHYTTYSLFVFIMIIGLCFLEFVIIRALWRGEVIAYLCEDTKPENTFMNGRATAVFKQNEDIAWKNPNVIAKEGDFVKMRFEDFSGREVIRDTKCEITVNFLGKKFTFYKPIFVNKDRYNDDYQNNQDVLNKQIQQLNIGGIKDE